MPTITVSRDFKSSPEQVFDAWLDAETAKQWLFSTPDGEMIRAEIDARVGGGFNFTERREDIDAVHLGEYFEIERPRRLVFDFWVEPYSEGQRTRVEIDIIPNGEGCTLTMKHSGVPDEWAERTQQGWQTILGKL